MVHFSNRRSKRADARRVDIMRAAATVFRARGFSAAGMRDIAVAADLSPGNLYHYFRGKEELLFFCQDRSLDRLLDALAAARTAGPKDRRPLAVRLRELAIAHVLCLIDGLEGSAAHLEVDALPPPLRERIVAKRDRYERGVRALVAAESGRGAEAAVATRAFLGALNWTAHWFRPDGAQPPQRVAELVADYAVAGLIYGPTRSHHLHRQRRAGRGRVRPLQDAPRGAA
ncbi:MAG TPA: TetR/AcrR family transcriptional regulator [Vicinamibacterales bacterium]|nr:TetR/AcrR family transcriptional regulator [Vicinamibacterales bacterium]